MKRYTWIISILFLFAGLIVEGQGTQFLNQATLYTGPGYLVRQDLVFSPQVHTDLSFIHAGVAYTRQAQFYQEVKFGFSMHQAMVTQPYTFYSEGEEKSALPHQFIFVDLDYVLGKSYSGPGSFKFTMGGLFSSDIQTLNYVYGRVGNFGYFAALGLGLSVNMEHSTGEKGKFSTSLHFPVVSWMARSPYLVNDDAFIENQRSHSGIKSFFAFLEDGNLVALNKLQRLDIEIGYSYKLSKRTGLGIGYIFGFIHSSQPRNLLSYSHHIELSAHLKF